MYKFVFYFEKLEFKTPSTIIFKGNCTHCDSKMVLEYYGGGLDVVSNSAIPEKYRIKLEDALNKDYGYPGPNGFDQEVIKEIFENCHRYEFK